MAHPPILIETIPDKIVSEGGTLGPFDLNEFIQSKDPLDDPIIFQGELSGGAALPQGIICTQNGILSGIPASGTQGDYEIVITAKNAADEPLITSFRLCIKSRIAIESSEVFNDLKARVWEALGKDLPLPEFDEFLNRPVTASDIYYLLQRFATMTIWDVYNLDPPGEKILLTFEDANPHFAIYDRGSCLVATPKDLFSHERTLADALQTAKVLAREVYKRGWVLEFAGFDKMVRAAWVELQIQGELHGKHLEILHYTPTEEDLKIFAAEVSSPLFKSLRARGGI